MLFQTAGVRIGGVLKELSVPTGRIGRVRKQTAKGCAAEESDTCVVINLVWVFTRPGPGADIRPWIELCHPLDTTLPIIAMVRAGRRTLSLGAWLVELSFGPLPA
jgi:hypothetical protein